MRLVTWLLVAVLLWGAQAASQTGGYVLRAEDLACLQANAEVYRALAGDTLFVAVGDCPEVPRNPLLGTLTNEGPDVRLDEALPYDSFVYLTKAQLNCLLEAEVRPGATLYGFQPETCALDARE